MKKILTLKKLNFLKKKKKILGLCHGVFDIIHYGHLKYFKSAKKKCDILIVSITADKYVDKGPGRPLNKIQQRLEMLSSLEIIDFVIISENESAVKIIDLIKPDYYFKGPDYKDKKKDLSKKILFEEKATKKNGGKLIFTDDETYSSSSIINKEFIIFNEEQKKFLKFIKSKYSLDYIISKLNEITKIEPIVIGEPIIDEYINVEVKGIGSKSPILAAKYLKKNQFAGGSLVIANHLSALGCKTNIILPSKTSNETDEKIYNKLNANIKKNYVKFNEWILPKKIRFLNQYKSEKLFEYFFLSEFEPNNIDTKIINKINKIKLSNSILLISDFGHLFFSKKLINKINLLKIHKSINVQSNSANYGFNLFHKYKNFDFITLDEKELRLSENNNVDQVSVLLKNILINKKIKKNGTLTLGSRGSIFFSKNNRFSFCPTFIEDPQDSVGAGDAYFAIASLLNFIKCQPELIIFISNCYAGLKTKIVGNLAVEKIKLINHIKSLLA